MTIQDVAPGLAWSVAALVTGAASLLARRRLPPAAKLAMQFGLDGRPTWRAPRDPALAFLPLFAALIGLVVTLAFARLAGSQAHPPGPGLFWAIVLGPPSGVIAAHLWWLRKAVMLWAQEERPIQASTPAH